MDQIIPINRPINEPADNLEICRKHADLCQICQKAHFYLSLDSLMLTIKTITNTTLSTFTIRITMQVVVTANMIIFKQYYHAKANLSFGNINKICIYYMYNRVGCFPLMSHLNLSLVKFSSLPTVSELHIEIIVIKVSPYFNLVLLPFLISLLLYKHYLEITAFLVNSFFFHYCSYILFNYYLDNLLTVPQV